MLRRHLTAVGLLKVRIFPLRLVFLQFGDRYVMPTRLPFGFSPASRMLIVAGFGTLLAFSLTACKSNSPAPIVANNSAADSGGPDPADANMATGANGQPTQVMGQSQAYTPQQQGQSYAPQQGYPAGQQAPAPVVQGYANTAQGYQDNQGYSDQEGYTQGYVDGQAAEADTAPPPLPTAYEQPPAPDPNDIWTPGYWDYGSGGYYWVPGTWVAAPYYGALWTPPYWGWYGGHYRFHRGYWGPHIGYYGGINYGFGYIGTGYYGGYWRGHDFFYNRAVNNVNVEHIHNVYDRNVVVNNVSYSRYPTVRTSYNGGPGGIHAEPRPFEVAAEHERHEAALPAQVAMRQQAVTNRSNFFAANQGRPAQIAFAHPPNAPAALPANNPGMNRPGEPNRFGEPGRPGNVPNAGAFNRPGEPAGNFNHPGAPAGAPAGNFNRPGETAGHPGAPNTQPFNRPGEVGVHPGAPNPAAPAHGTPGPGGQPFDRPSSVENHGTFNRPGAPVANPPANPGVNRPAAANPGFYHPGEPANRPAPPAPNPGFQPHINQPAGNGGFSRPAPDTVRGGFNQPSPGFGNRPMQPQHSAPAEAPHVAPAPAPHVDVPHAAPAPHMEAPRPAPAPHMEAPHGPPAGGGGGHPGGGGGHGPR
jgi:hypothetical protein